MVKNISSDAKDMATGTAKPSGARVLVPVRKDPAAISDVLPAPEPSTTATQSSPSPLSDSSSGNFKLGTLNLEPAKQGEGGPGDRASAPLAPDPALALSVSSSSGSADPPVQRSNDSTPANQQDFPQLAGPSESIPSPQRGPQIAKRSSHAGHPSGGGLGKPLGQGEGAFSAAVTTYAARPRNGKIAALPPEVRDQVNQMLRAGCSYSDIAHRLGTWGYSGISPANISNWKYGGFAAWLQQQQQTESRLTLPRALERTARSLNLDHLQHNAILSACNQLSVILAKFDPDRALALLYQRPQLLPAFIGALAALGRCTRDLTKTFELVHQRETAIHKQLENITQPAPSSACRCEANGNGKPHFVGNLESPQPAPHPNVAQTSPDEVGTASSSSNSADVQPARASAGLGNYPPRFSPL